jgi:hypothetical protein
VSRDAVPFAEFAVGDYVRRVGAASWGVGVVVGVVGFEQSAWRVARRLGWSGRGLDREAGGRGDVGWLVLACRECGEACKGCGVGRDGTCAGMSGARVGVRLHFPRWQDLRRVAMGEAVEVGEAGGASHGR